MIQIKLLDVALQLLPTALPVLATLPCHSIMPADYIGTNAGCSCSDWKLTSCHISTEYVHNPEVTWTLDI